MPVRKLKDSDFKGLASLYKRYYRMHNVFGKPEKKVIEYLKGQPDECLVADDGGIRGALFVVNKTSSRDGKHRFWKLKHIAFDSEDVGRDLLAAAEKKIRLKSETAKIEISVAESEPQIDFFEENGYQKEAEMKNHYRWDETCFIFSKSLS